MKTLDDLKQEFDNCTLCALCNSRKAVMFSDGSPDARLMLIAERVGGMDEENLKLFSGPAGDLLQKILAAPGVEIPRNDVYITNLVLCRTPGDRVPRAAEIRKCAARLQEQIQIISPKLLIAAGRLPMLYFLNFKGTMEQHRGWHESLIGSSSFKTFLTFNPASALYGERSEIRQKKLLIYQDWKEIGTYYRTL